MRSQLVRCPRGHGRLVVDAECGVDRGLTKEISDCKRQRLESQDCRTTKDHVTWWGSAEPHQVFLFSCARFSAPVCGVSTSCVCVFSVVMDSQTRCRQGRACIFSPARDAMDSAAGPS